MRKNDECRSISEELNHYLDHTLTIEKRAKVDRHLAGCGACRKRFGREEELVRLLSTLPVQNCPPEVVRSIETYVVSDRRAQQRSAARVRFFSWPRIAFGFALCLIFLWIVVRPGSDSGTAHNNVYSGEDILRAREQAKQGLTLTAMVFASTERSTLKNILYNYVPRTMLDSIEKTVKTLKGG